MPDGASDWTSRKTACTQVQRSWIFFHSHPAPGELRHLVEREALGLRECRMIWPAVVKGHMDNSRGSHDDDFRAVAGTDAKATRRETVLATMDHADIRGLV